MNSISERQGRQKWTSMGQPSEEKPWGAHGRDHRNMGGAAAPERFAIVVVEDDPDDLFLLRRALRKEGITDQALQATSGEQAIRLLSGMDSRVDNVCLVLDVKLPDMSGFELMEQIRNLHLPQSMKFVFLTGSRNPGFEKRARAACADGFFHKPSYDEEWAGIARALRGAMEIADA